MHFVSNPSHLEAVDPVAMGRTRAKQTRRGAQGRQQVIAITMHGDAAFAGQGVWAETLNMAGLPGYDVGGSVHIIVNNLIGFTTQPRDTCSSRFSSDVAKRLPMPIFHVNAEDFEAVVRVGRIALDYRYAFGTPVGDRSGRLPPSRPQRSGRSTITQPLRYRKIEAHPPTWQIYAEKTARTLRRLCSASATNWMRPRNTLSNLRRTRRCAACRAIGMAIVAAATILHSKWIPESRKTN